MSNKKIDCYILSSAPLPILLPVECVAEVVENPTVLPLSKPPANWMKGHVNWQNQRLSLMSFAALLDSEYDKPSGSKSSLVVLNAIPDAARVAYSGLLVDGDIEQVSVDGALGYGEIPDDVDKRYVEAVVCIDEKEFIIPKLASLAVAFTYI